MPTANMSLILPTEGGDVGVWDTELNAALSLVDAHDHSTGKGVKVTPAGMNINALLDMNGNRITELAAAMFNSVASSAMTSVVRALWFNSADGELYIRTNGGSDIKLTNGAALNVSALGGIAGDYTTSTAQVAYDVANKRYTMRTATSPAKFADVHMASVKIHQVDPSTSSFGVTISVGVMAANYTLTLPTTLPGSQSLMQVSAAGAVSYSNTIPNAVSMGATLAVTGAATLTGGITNNVPLTLGATAAVNQSLTLSGTGTVKRGTRTRVIPGGAIAPGVSASWGGAADGSYTTSNAGTTTVFYDLRLDAEECLQQIDLSYFGNTLANITAIGMYKVDSAGGITGVNTPFSIAAPVAAWASTSFTPTSPAVTGGGNTIILKVTTSNNGIRIGNITVYVDVP